MEYQPLNKKAISCLRAAASISAAVFALILAGLIIFLNVVEAPFVLLLILYIITGLSVLWFVINISVLPVLRYKRYKYYVSPDRVEVVEGLFFIHRSIVPVERIHQIMVEKGPLDNVYKLAKVKVITAGGQVIINMLEEEVANEIAENLKRLIDKKIKKSEADVNGL